MFVAMNFNRNRWTRQLAVGCCTFFLSLFLPNAGAAQPEFEYASSDVAVNVVTRNATYRYVLHNGNLADVSEKCLQKNGPCASQNAMRDLLAQRDFVAAEAKASRNVLPKGVGWALFSSDRKWVVYGFEGVFGSEKLALRVARPDDQRDLYSVADPDLMLECLRWLPDGKSLAILDSKSRLSVTPWGILAAFTGHGMPVSRYTLRIISFDQNDKISVSKFPLPQSFDDSVACLDMSHSGG